MDIPKDSEGIITWEEGHAIDRIVALYEMSQAIKLALERRRIL